MNIRSLTRGDGAVIGAAVLLLIASFLPFFSLDLGDGSKSASSWSPALFPLLPTVTLGALATAALFVFARQQPGRQVIGLTLDQWGTALGVFVGWAAFWSIFSTVIPSAMGSNHGVSKGAGAWLTFIFGIGLAVVAVLNNRLPALKAPLMGATPAPQPYVAGGPQPYAAGPPQAGYGYPGGAQSVEGGYGQPAAQQQSPYGAPAPQPTAAAAKPAGDFSAFWFAVPVPRPLYSEDGTGGQIAELTPGTWYLAVDQRGAALVAQTQDGRRGVLQDSSGIQRG
ncbi:hypothetical protein [Actinacidiphila acididurans]|uniref:Integral membrane protein n=1 Tax=Actinacidiphila acididurans TaxID=2784346 RepID=A0ABS2TXK5_9ACTN|nr:hypothetical protein [Actinacidiphila acididurans]MBM9508083.1 hypothetical protein [Actinacidiphila acididurans]